MLATERMLDLCSTCVEYPHCHSDYRRPVWFCEQFSDYVANEKPPARLKKNPTPPQNFDFPDSRFKGLCVNCDHRETCPLAKREGGIWHCEEYQ